MIYCRLWITVLAASLPLLSCVAPISYKEIANGIPAVDHSIPPLDAAVRELESGRASADPWIASGHFVECARLAKQPALEGDADALALYNHAVGLLFERLNRADSLSWGRIMPVGGEANASSLRVDLEAGSSGPAAMYRLVDHLEFRGKFATVHATREGIGARLVATYPAKPDYRSNYERRKSSRALTAVLRFDAPQSGRLELYDPLEVDHVSIAGNALPLAADFSAPVSLALALERPDKMGLIRLVNPQKYSETARLSQLHKYEHDRIPVLMVHGLQDTPATWAPMFHALIQDPEIREKYQFWVFSYPSGYPYPYSASLLRRELDGLKNRFPDHEDIVIIGHSMGGIISRLMVTDAEDRIWRVLFGEGPDEMRIPGHSARILKDSIIFNHRSDISRAIFIAAPHRGSELASGWIGRTASRLVRTPTFLADVRNAVLSVLTADAASLVLDRTPNSIDTLSPRNNFVREVNKLPITPGVPYHSIMGDRGKGGNLDKTRPVSSDGVVPYWSSHLEGAASEKIIPSNHSAHQHPEGIAEVRRILRLHAGLAPSP